MSGPVPKPGLLDIAPYVPGKAKAVGFARPVKLSANENALGCSPAAVEAFRATAADLNLYPDPRATALREAIAARYDLEPERILFGCGSDELFTLACQTLIQPGDNVVQPAHGFAAWAIAARAAGGEVRSASERDLTADVDALLAAVDGRTRIVFLANPANPTGTVLPATEVARLHMGLPERVLLVLDGAYAEYASRLPGFDDGLDLARAAPNVLVTRTFSKIHGLASLRIGWGYAASALVAAMDRIRLPFNASGPAQAAAVAALADTGFVEQSLDHVERWRPVLEEAFRRRGARVGASAANFITPGFPDALKAEALIARFAQDGVLVRGLTGYGLPDYVRITIGTEAQNRRVIALLP